MDKRDPPAPRAEDPTQPDPPSAKKHKTQEGAKLLKDTRKDDQTARQNRLAAAKAALSGSAARANALIQEAAPERESMEVRALKIKDQPSSQPPSPTTRPKACTWQTPRVLRSTPTRPITTHPCQVRLTHGPAYQHPPFSLSTPPPAPPTRTPTWTVMIIVTPSTLLP
jgi:hypothetical protein